jgi:hypothetical protein
MFVGLVLENGKFVEAFHVNANDEVVAEKKLNAYISNENSKEEGNNFTGVLLNGDRLGSLTRLRY